MPDDPETATDLTPPGAPVPANPAPRRLFIVAFVAAVVGLAVTLSFGFADHDPKPHHVPLAVAAPARVQSQLAAGLERSAPGGFRLLSEPDQQAVMHSVHAQAAAGGLVVSGGANNTVVVAGAQGTLLSQTVTKALTAASAQMHKGVTTVDVAPLNSGDKAGLGAFVFELGLLIPSVIGSIALFLIGMRSRLWWRVLAALAFAVLAGLGGTLAMDTIFGSLTGNGGALIGVGILGAAAFVLFIAACQAVVGLPGTALAAITFIFMGNAISGGSVPVGFLPDVFRQIAPWLPNNAIIRSVRDVTYYQGTDLGHPMLVFGLWIGVAAILLIAVDLLHLRARAKAPELASEIYRTSGLAHLRALFGGGGVPATVLATSGSTATTGSTAPIATPARTAPVAEAAESADPQAPVTPAQATAPRAPVVMELFPAREPALALESEAPAPAASSEESAHADGAGSSAAEPDATERDAPQSSAPEPDAPHPHVEIPDHSAVPAQTGTPVPPQIAVRSAVLEMPARSAAPAERPSRNGDGPAHADAPAHNDAPAQAEAPAQADAPAHVNTPVRVETPEVTEVEVQAEVPIRIKIVVQPKVHVETEVVNDDD